jgi:CopG family transcriptional regulator, nickel-responsive regulator
MATVERISMSLEKDLCVKLDQMVKKSKAANRSEFIRDLIREQIVEEEWEKDEEAVGAITLVYDHHANGLPARLTEVQHGYHHEIVSGTHVHLDHDMCVEMLLARGRAGRLKEIADRLKGMKGVLHAQLSMSTTGKRLKKHEHHL